MTSNVNDMSKLAEDIEAVAKIIDPDAWHETLPADGCGEYWAGRRSKARGKAQAARNHIINSPETADFIAGVALEAAHQRDRWGTEHDAGKSPFDWFWLIGYLAQKAADAAARGDDDKAMHHTVSTGAAMANWHAALCGKSTSMRPGTQPTENR